MQIENIDDLIEHQIQDLYDAENQLVKALPKIAESVASTTLKDALTKHLKETEDHVKRLEQVAQMLSIDAEGEGCKGMEGLLDEGEEILKSANAGPLLDSAIIGACQKAEHYEIAGYGTVITQLEALEKDEEAKILKNNLADEEHADKKLTEIAENEVTPEAVNVDNGTSVEEMEDEEETDDSY